MVIDIPNRIYYNYYDIFKGQDFSVKVLYKKPFL